MVEDTDSNGAWPKTAAVFGASGGIGRALCEELVRRGCARIYAGSRAGHSYRASKTALNMLIRNFAIELGRTHPGVVVIGLHPGTVATELSQPFQSNVAEGKLFTPEHSAQKLLDVLLGLEPNDSGNVFDWQGRRVPE